MWIGSQFWSQYCNLKPVSARLLMMWVDRGSKSVSYFSVGREQVTVQEAQALFIEAVSASPSPTAC